MLKRVVNLGKDLWERWFQELYQTIGWKRMLQHVQIDMIVDNYNNGRLHLTAIRSKVHYQIKRRGSKIWNR